MAESKKSEKAESQARGIVQPIDESRVQTGYANFFRVTNTAEEVIVDFGLNPATAEAQQVPVVLSSRLVLNHFTAKRLFQALGVVLQRHETAFGAVETNVQRRLVKQTPPKT